MTAGNSANPLTILIDSRDQLPYDFGPIILADKLTANVETVTLRTGDYSIACASPEPRDHIVIERKSLADLYGSLGNGRERFRAEFERLGVYGYSAVVIEAGLDQIAAPWPHLKHATKLHPSSVIGTLLAWSQRYGVPVWTCPDRSFACLLTFRALYRWWLDAERRAGT